ncbi:MAG: response regulator [Nitrospirae bacterium]|nr:response regulator [Nitrospirota bacterium]
MSVKVLVVDDSKSFLDLETSFLKRSECTVLKATNGLEALRIAKAEKPDIVFLDLEMPVMNGIECCRFIKSDIELKDMPVVILTSSFKESECYAAGCSSYLRKPVDEDIFISEIKKFIPIKERTDPRFKVSMPVNIKFKGTGSSGTAKNISRFGILLITESPFAIGSSVGLEFSLPDSKDKIKTKGIVIREARDDSGASGFGVRFFETLDKDQSAIDSFIAKQIGA